MVVIRHIDYTQQRIIRCCVVCRRAPLGKEDQVALGKTARLVHSALGSLISMTQGKWNASGPSPCP